ncbi:MAG: hypothetical protein AAGF12_37160 [Myxococcota bacterium]
MKTLIATLAGLAVLAVAGCGAEPAADITVERLPEVRPNLPQVPTLPPPPHPVTYGDSSYSVYGLRARLRNTIDNEHGVTGYIVEIYTPPECPEGERCPLPAAPHMWIADTPNETEQGNRLTVVGYADNQAMIDEAIELHERGRYEPPAPETGLLPIPVDFAVGAKIKLNGRFTRVSGSGFNISDGLLEYRGHEIVEPPAGSAEET